MEKKELKEEIGNLSFVDLLKKITAYRAIPATTPTPLCEELLSRIDKSYKLLGLVGIGGEGIVLAAIDAMQTKIIVKVALATFTKDTRIVHNIFTFAKHEFVNKQNSFATRFIEGCRLQQDLYMLTLEKKPDFFQVPAIRKISQNPSLYVEMEYIEGIQIIRWLKEKNSIGYALKMFEKYLLAVQFFHDVGIIHRDLKTDNVLISKNDKIAIVDWTLSKIIGDRNLTLPGEQMGTIPFASPKLIEGASKSACYPDDIFSLGFCLYEFFQQAALPKLITAENFKEEQELQEYIDYLGLRLPRPLRNVFINATAIREEARYQIVEIFLEKFRAAIIELGIIDDHAKTMVEFPGANDKPEKCEDLETDWLYIEKSLDTLYPNDMISKAFIRAVWATEKLKNAIIQEKTAKEAQGTTIIDSK